MAIILQEQSTKTKTFTRWFPTSLSVKSLVRRNHTRRVEEYYRLQDASCPALDTASTESLVHVLYRVDISSPSESSYKGRAKDRSIAHNGIEFEGLSLDLGENFADLFSLSSDDLFYLPSTTVSEAGTSDTFCTSDIDDGRSLTMVEDNFTIEDDYILKVIDNFTAKEDELEFITLEADEKTPHKFTAASVKDAGHLAFADNEEVKRMHKYIAERALAEHDGREKGAALARRRNFKYRPSSLRIEF